MENKCTTEKIGFIGLGIMGRPMAANLLAGGCDLMVYNRSKEPVDELAAKGAHAASSVSEVGSTCDIVITMLPDGPDVEAVCLCIGGLVESMRPGSMLIDMSSTAPDVAQRVGAALTEKNCSMLDAPVSGGEPGAIVAKLAIMVGGEAKDFNRALPVLRMLGNKITHVGPLGAGQTTKLVNQMLVAIHIAAMGEAFSLAAKAGLDPKTVFEAIQSGLAGSNVLNAKMPLVLDRNFEPGFRLRLHRKDLNNALAAGRDLGACMPLTGIVQQFITSMVSRGKGNEDHGGLVQVFEELSGTLIAPHRHD